MSARRRATEGAGGKARGASGGMKRPAIIAVAAALVAPLSAAADAPSGPVALIVAGAVDKTNRPPFDAARDSFFDYHERSFDRAWAFDLAMLEAFPQRRATIDRGAGPEVFSGPRLADVLDSVGCRGALSTLALDGFGSEIPAAEVRARDWILATRADGRPFAIGGRGPLWLLFDPPGDRPATEEERGMWPWALFYIRCEGARRASSGGGAAGSRPKSRSTRQPSPSRA